MTHAPAFAENSPSHDPLARSSRAAVGPGMAGKSPCILFADVAGGVRLAAKLGVPVDNVLMYGSSAGGTSAILTGSRRTTRTGIVAVCPFLRPDKYREGVIAAGMRAMGNTMDDYEQMMQETPWRFNPLIALKDAHQSGHDIRLFVGQNLKDKSTISRHFPGVWRRWDIDPGGQRFLDIDPTAQLHAAAIELGKCLLRSDLFDCLRFGRFRCHRQNP